MNIVLEKWELKDIPQFIDLMDRMDREFLSYQIPYPYTELDAHCRIETALKEEKHFVGMHRKIVVDGKIAGNISISRKSDIFCVDSEISYCLLPEYSGKGIMSEATKLICNHVFLKFPLLRITGIVMEDHIASRKILEKNGFVLEGIIKKATYKLGKIHNLCYYAKFRE